MYLISFVVVFYIIPAFYVWCLMYYNYNKGLSNYMKSCHDIGDTGTKFQYDICHIILSLTPILNIWVMIGNIKNQ